MGHLRGISQHGDRPAERAVFLNLAAPIQATARWLFASGHAADIVLVVMMLEFAWLVTRGGWRARDAALRLGPGALMLVALRGALVGADWRWIAAALLASFPVHLADLARPRRSG